MENFKFKLALYFSVLLIKHLIVVESYYCESET